MEIPEDLRLLAAHEEAYKEHMFKSQHGIADDNQSTMLLKEALAAGQKGKAGIGFKGKADKEKNRFEEDEDLIDKYKSMVDHIKQKEFQLKAAELMGYEDGVEISKQDYIVKKRVSRFTDREEEAPQEGYREVRVTASEYHKEKLEEYRAKMKEQLKSKFRNSFVQKGKLTFDKSKGNQEETHQEQNDHEEGEEENENPENRPTEDIECLENLDDKFDEKDKFGEDPMYDDEN